MTTFCPPERPSGFLLATRWLRRTSVGRGSDDQDEEAATSMIIIFNLSRSLLFSLIISTILPAGAATIRMKRQPHRTSAGQGGNAVFGQPPGGHDKLLPARAATALIVILPAFARRPRHTPACRSGFMGFRRPPGGHEEFLPARGGDVATSGDLTEFCRPPGGRGELQPAEAAAASCRPTGGSDRHSAGLC